MASDPTSVRRRWVAELAKEQAVVEGPVVVVTRRFICCSANSVGCRCQAGQKGSRNSLKRPLVKVSTAKYAAKPFISPAILCQDQLLELRSTVRALKEQLKGFEGAPVNSRRRKPSRKGDPQVEPSSSCLTFTSAKAMDGSAVVCCSSSPENLTRRFMMV